MHVPDGFFAVPTSAATAVVALGGVTIALKKVRAGLDDRLAPLAGLVAVFIFAAQMLNFPVGAGTSGHLLGGALAAILVGPWAATLCLSVVLTVQALLFADGGLTALGTNITLMGLVGVWVGWAVFCALRWALPERVAAIPIASALAGLVSVPATALAFVGLYALGGAAPIPLGTLTAAMIGWHALIGIGEAAITAMVVGSLVRTRPDLVHAAAFLNKASQPLERRQGVPA